MRQQRGAKSEQAEESWDALNTYAHDLVAQAEAGKLDPTIGRDEVLLSGNDASSMLGAFPHFSSFRKFAEWCKCFPGAPKITQVLLKFFYLNFFKQTFI